MIKFLKSKKLCLKLSVFICVVLLMNMVSDVKVLGAEAPNVYITGMSAGTVAGSTRLTLTPSKEGNTFKYVIGTSEAVHPQIGSTVSGGTVYTSGSNIVGVDPKTNKFVDVYELDSNTVVAFTEITLTNSVISAPTLKTPPIVVPGTTSGSIQLTLAPNNGGNLQYVVSKSAASSIPTIGSTTPSGIELNKFEGTKNDIIGVDSTTNKYIDVYEFDSNGVAAFIEITLNSSQITAPAIGKTPTASPGTVGGSTKLTLTPSASGNTFKVNVVSQVTTLPIIGGNPVGTAYTSGSNITGVDSTNKYVDVYELDSTGKIANFSEITLIGDEISAPGFTTAPIVAPGTEDWSTKLTLTPNTADNTFRCVISTSAAIYFPVKGSTAPSVTPYTSESNIAEVDPTTKKYVDVYEIDSDSKVAAFAELILKGSQIKAPGMDQKPTAAPGTAAGSTKLTLTPKITENTFKINITSKATEQVVGSIPTTAKSYTSGSDIKGVDPITNRYIDVYEFDSTGKFVSFSEVELQASDITAPVLKKAPIVAAGTTGESIKLTLTPNTTGDSFQYVVRSSTLGTLPVIGSTTPSGIVLYTSGSNITGVDSTTNKYVDLYELDSGSKVVAFTEITLRGSQIAAPAIGSVPTASTGTAAGSTKLALTPGASGNTFKVSVVSKSKTALPTIGSSPVGKVYKPGDDIKGVDPIKNKYIDVYELASSGKVANFSEITLEKGYITAPLLKRVPVAVTGSEPGSTKLTLTPNTKGDTLKISTSAAISIPAIGSTASSATEYTSGSNIKGVDSTTNKYIDVYELDPSGGVVAFAKITLKGNQIAAPAISIPSTVARGTASGSTKLTLTPDALGNTFKVNVVSKSKASLPAIGSSPAGKVYKSDDDIKGVDPIKNKYIDVYELDSYGKVANFSEITLEKDDITAPVLKRAPVAVKGSKAGTTKLKVTPNASGDTFKISTSAAISIPVIGAPAPVGDVYTSGNDIPGMDPTTNKYVDVYEIDKDSKVVAFNRITLKGNQITAPAIGTTPTATPGKTAGSTTLTLELDSLGSKFAVNVASRSKATSLPVTGSNPAGKVYTLGSDITGVDPIKNKYIDIYELDLNGKVVNFSEITLENSNITASALKKAPIAAAGTQAGTTKLTLTPNNQGDSFQYVVRSSPLGTLPVLGSTTPSGTVYTSGDNITGVDSITNKYVDVYEIDSTGRFVQAFTEITLDSSKIKAAN